MRKVLLDTDVLINFLRGREGARAYLSTLVEDATLYCSAITVAEIHSGMREHEREKTNDLLDSLTIVDVTRAIAERAGRYRQAEKRQAIELADCLIAATAAEKSAVLATGNGKHYPMSDIRKLIVA